MKSFTCNGNDVIKQSLSSRPNVNTDTIFESVNHNNISTGILDDSSQKPLWLLLQLYKCYIAVRISLVQMFGKIICNHKTILINTRWRILNLIHIYKYVPIYLGYQVFIYQSYFIVFPSHLSEKHLKNTILWDYTKTIISCLLWSIFFHSPFARIKIILNVNP